MKKILFLLMISMALLGVPNSHARNSAASYDTKFYSQQEFVQGYNDSTGTIYRDYIVGVDVPASGINSSATPGINPNANAGQYITVLTNSTTDNIYAFGVADETIPAGQLGRICIRGPHKIVWTPGSSLGQPSLGMVVSQCKNNIPAISVNGTLASVVSGGWACPYSTATGTAGAMIGTIINATATTDTGDVGQTTNAQSFTTSSEYWAWINPQVLR